MLFRSVLVENRAGVLNRITGLFSRRAFNIDSLAVGVTDDPTISRITIIVDSDMNIIEFNAAAEACFKISRREALEKALYELIDVSDFQFVFESKQSITNKKVHYREYNITTEQSIIYIEKENIAMGIFRDITKEEKELENRYHLRDVYKRQLHNIFLSEYDGETYGDRLHW